MDVNELLRREESFSALAAPDTGGTYVVGFGHNVNLRPISRRAADLILSEDVQDIQEQLSVRWPWMFKLSAVRNAVFVSMAYQMGVGGLATFVRALEHAERGEWERAGTALLDSRWARQTPARAARHVRMLVLNDWLVP